VSPARCCSPREGTVVVVGSSCRGDGRTLLLLLPGGIRSSELGYTLLLLLDMSSFLFFLSPENNYYLVLNIEREKRNHDEINKHENEGGYKCK
jgi:hypothetical protein